MLTNRWKRLSHGLFLLAACLLILPIAAQTHQPAGPSIQVGQGGNDLQIAWRCDADITMIVWSANSQGSDPDISIQGRFYSGLTPTGPQFQVNQITQGTQKLPKVHVLDNGDFAVAWQTQIEAQLHTFHLRTFDRITLAPRPEQEFGMTLNQSQQDFDYDFSEDGRIGLVWTERPSPVIKAQTFDLDGQPVGPEINFEIEPEVKDNFISVSRSFIHLGPDSTVLRWRTYESINLDEDQEYIRFQRFGLDGTPVGPTLLGTGADLVFGDGPSIIDPRSHLSRNGDILFSFAYAWFPLGKEQLFSVYAKRFDEAGAQTQFVNVFDSYFTILGNHAVSAEDDGDFMVIWEENQDAFANRLAVGEEDPGPRFNPVDTSGTPRHLAMDYNGPGSPFAVVWADNGVHWRRFLSYPDMLQDGFESGNTSRWCVARSGQ